MVLGGSNSDPWEDSVIYSHAALVAILIHSLRFWLFHLMWTIATKERPTSGSLGESVKGEMDWNWAVISLPWLVACFLYWGLTTGALGVPFNEEFLNHSYLKSYRDSLPKSQPPNNKSSPSNLFDLYITAIWWPAICEQWKQLMYGLVTCILLSF